MHLARILLIAIIITGLAACSGKPSNGAIGNALEIRLQEQGLGELFDVRNIQRTNGYAENDNHYVADIEYDLVFRKSFEEVAESLEENEDGELLSTLGAGIGLIALRLQYGEFSAGDSEHQTERITLVDTERGWRIK